MIILLVIPPWALNYIFGSSVLTSHSWWSNILKKILQTSIYIFWQHEWAVKFINYCCWQKISRSCKFFSALHALHVRVLFTLLKDVEAQLCHRTRDCTTFTKAANGHWCSRRQNVVCELLNRIMYAIILFYNI